MDNHEYENYEEEQDKSSSSLDTARDAINKFREHIQSKESPKGVQGISQRPPVNGAEKATKSAGSKASKNTVTNPNSASGPSRMPSNSLPGASTGTPNMASNVPPSSLGAASEGVKASEGALKAGKLASEGGSLASEGALTTGKVASESAAAAGKTALTTGKAAAAGGATTGGTAAAGGAAATGGAVAALGWVALIIVIIIIIIVVIFLAFSVVDSMSMRYGVSEDEVVKSNIKDNPGDNITIEDLNSLEDLNEKFANYECETSFWESIFGWLDDKFGEYCSAVKHIGNKIAEKKNTDEVVLSPGLIISTILYTYENQPYVVGEDKNRINDSSPSSMLNDAFVKEGLIKQSDVDLMINNMIANESHYYIFDEIDEEKTVENGVERTTVYMGCKKEIEKPYFDIDRYLIFLRFGSDISNFYAKSIVKYNSWINTEDVCKSDSIEPTLPESTDNVTYTWAENYRAESLQEFKDYQPPIISNFFQKADYSDIDKEDVFTPVKIDAEEKILDYKQGFIYQKFPGFKTQNIEAKQIPKMIEKIVDNIDQYENTMNEILGIKSLDSSTMISPPGLAPTVTGNKFADTALQYFGLTQSQMKSYWYVSGAWCARFVSFIFHSIPEAYVKIDGIKWNKNLGGVSAVSTYLNFFAKHHGDGLYFYHSRANVKKYGTYTLNDGSAYTPKIGDLIFYDYTSPPYRGNPVSAGHRTTDHIAIIVEVNGDKIVSLGGNERHGTSISKVRKTNKDLDDSNIVGYGVWDY